MKQHYDNMEYAKVCLSTLHWFSWLSGSYLQLCKDRLYCDHAHSVSRHSGVSTMVQVTRSLTSVLAPVLPHLCHEVTSAAPVLPSPFTSGWSCDDQWSGDDEFRSVVTTLETLREELNKSQEKLGDCDVVVSVDDGVMETLSRVDTDQVAEVLGVLRVRLEPGDQVTVVSVSRSSGAACVRCRRLTSAPGQELCDRCHYVVNN